MLPLQQSRVPVSVNITSSDAGSKHDYVLCATALGLSIAIGRGVDIPFSRSACSECGPAQFKLGKSGWTFGVEDPLSARLFRALLEPVDGAAAVDPAAFDRSRAEGSSAEYFGCDHCCTACSPIDVLMTYQTTNDLPVVMPISSSGSDIFDLRSSTLSLFRLPVLSSYSLLLCILSRLIAMHGSVHLSIGHLDTTDSSLSKRIC